MYLIDQQTSKSESIGPENKDCSLKGEEGEQCDQTGAITKLGFLCSSVGIIIFAVMTYIMVQEIDKQWIVVSVQERRKMA